MEDKETPRMRKYGESKRLELWWQLHSTSLPVRDFENFRPMDFCSTECTTNKCAII